MKGCVLELYFMEYEVVSSYYPTLVELAIKHDYSTLHFVSHSFKPMVLLTGFIFREKVGY